VSGWFLECADVLWIRLAGVQCVAVYCSVLQCVAVCCSVLQWIRLQNVHMCRGLGWQ